MAKTRAAMQRAGIDTLVVTDPSNMHWLTGYDGWSFYVHQCVIVPPEGEPIWYGRGQDANGAKLLRLSTIGIMQYISPTLIFLIAVFAFKEPFSPARAAAFVLIWIALVVYSWSMFAGSKR